jgi:hypothetical protein
MGGLLMKKLIERWPVSEVILKLPLVDIKLKAPSPQGGSPQLATAEDSTFERVSSVSVALKACNGSFVTTELSGDSTLIANRPWVKAWEVFELFRLPDRKVALRAHNKRFVGARLYEDCQLVADRPTVQGWEAFTLSDLQDGRFAIQAFNGLYVCSDLNRDGQLIADRQDIGPWEAFTLVLAS